MLNTADFLKQIKTSDDHIGARLIYADWLEEQGDPQGEFIRIQCELHTRRNEVVSPEIRSLRLRERELLDANFRYWAHGLLEEGIEHADIHFRFGTVDSVTLGENDFHRFRDRLSELAPMLRGLRLDGAHNYLPRLESWPLLSSMKQLTFTHLGSDEADIRYLFRFLRRLPGLESLCLYYTDQGDPVARMLAVPDGFPRLIALDLSSIGITEVGVEQLTLNQALMKRLRWLNLSHNRLDDTAIGHLVNVGMDSLENLRLLGSSVSYDMHEKLEQQFGARCDISRIRNRWHAQ